MAIEGEHNWSELRIAMEIQSIELSHGEPWEKPAHVKGRETPSELPSRANAEGHIREPENPV